MQFSRKNNSFFIIYLIFIFLFLTMLSGCGKGEKPEEKEMVRPVKFLEINKSAGDGFLEYSGKITAVQEVFMAFEVPGKINSFPVREGQRVDKGMVLSMLDPRDYQSALDSRIADLNAARADYERARELYENNTISQRDLDVARRDFEVAKASANAAEKSMEDTRLVAPFTGLVAKTLVENYQNIQPKQPVLILQDDSSLEMVVDVPEKDYAKIDKNMPLSEWTRLLSPEIFVTSFPGKHYKAKFKEAAATADPVTRTFEITLGFSPPSDISILPGMTARVVITGSLRTDDSTIMIPAKSVLSDDNGNATVWLIDPSSNRVQQHPVQAGEMSGSNIQIKEGLKSGDIIAASGIHQLREGVAVRKYEKP